MQVSMQPRYAYNINHKGSKRLEQKVLKNAMKACNTETPNVNVLKYLEEERQFFAKMGARFNLACFLPIIAGYITSNPTLYALCTALWGFGMGATINYGIKAKRNDRVIEKVEQELNNNENNITQK